MVPPEVPAEATFEKSEKHFKRGTKMTPAVAAKSISTHPSEAQAELPAGPWLTAEGRAAASSGSGQPRPTKKDSAILRSEIARLGGENDRLEVVNQVIWTHCMQAKQAQAAHSAFVRASQMGRPGANGRPGGPPGGPWGSAVPMQMPPWASGWRPPHGAHGGHGHGYRPPFPDWSFQGQGGGPDRGGPGERQGDGRGYGGGFLAEVDAEGAAQIAMAASMAARTTVMIRNLPPQFTRSALVDMLDAEGFAGKYDFVYLPVEVRTNASLGYAFVNLSTHAQANAFWEVFEGFERWPVACSRVCGVIWSLPWQGANENVERFRNQTVMHESMPDEHKPAVYQLTDNAEKGKRLPFPAPTKPVSAPSQLPPAPAAASAAAATVSEPSQLREEGDKKAQAENEIEA